ncbi:Cyclophilin-like [Bacillus sp. OV166]|uniref:cyclophilin-like fold protein n=1 Tax=Bacillus sp. OV166 TaxID=1882763 RepID=UPI000A2ACD27|nr:cyclophilin-like fold protein [Bacillus sp. OV166]SMQ81614.1 Cyclophilin-like [Bacillus sp. OV166]
MKKILQVFFTVAFIFTFAGCSNSAANNRYTSSETSALSKNNSIDEHNKSQTDRAKETTTVKEITTINILVGNKTFTATLEDNDTAKALVKQLPLTVDMSDLNGNEKYNNLSVNLLEDKSIIPGRINEGDLMLYGNNCLVIFYKTFNTSYNYVKLGHIDNATGLTEAFGSGSVKVTFSVSE